MTFIPRFIAAFCVDRRVRRLELKKIISRVLFRPQMLVGEGGRGLTSERFGHRRREIRRCRRHR